MEKEIEFNNKINELQDLMNFFDNASMEVADFTTSSAISNAVRYMIIAKDMLTKVANGEY